MALCVIPAIFSIEIQGISHSLKVKMNFWFYKHFFLTIWKPMLLLTSWFVYKNIKMWWLFKGDVNQSLIFLWYYFSFMLHYFTNWSFISVHCDDSNSGWFYVNDVHVSVKVYCLSRLMIMNNRNQSLGLGSRIHRGRMGRNFSKIFCKIFWSQNVR